MTIEDEVLFASHPCIIANEHIYDDPNTPIWKQGSKSYPIHIGSGCWFGINVTVLAGATIGKNCVVGAGAVVKGNFPYKCVVAGNPARIIKKYDEDKGSWERYKC